MLFALANGIVVATAFRLATTAPLRCTLDRMLAAAVIGAAQIVVSLLIVGWALQALTPGAVLLTNAVIAVAAFALTRRLSPPLGPPRRLVPWLELWRTVCRHRWAALLVAVAGLALVWRLVLVYAFPPYTYDTVAYHLTTVAEWLQHGHMDTQHLHLHSASFPENMELLYAWVAVFLRSDQWIGAVQIAVALVGAASVAGMARLARIGWPAACAAGALFVLSPIVLTQSSTNYVDLGVGAFFLAGTYLMLQAFPSAVWGRQVDGEPAGSARSWSRSSLVFAGAAVGLAVGAKSIGPLLGGVSLVCLLAGIAVSRRRLGVARVRPAMCVLLVVLPLLCLGSFWYVRDLVEFSNPLYPANIKVLGVTIFHGPEPGLPSRLPSGSGPLAIAHSWGYDLTRLFQHSSGKYDRVDEYEGGLGLVWLLLGLPLLSRLAIAAWRSNQMLFWSLLVPLGLLFAIQPYRWWSRFTIFLLAPALVAIALSVDSSSSRRLKLAVQSLTLVCVAISLWLSSTHVIAWGHVYGIDGIVSTAQKPWHQRTLGRLFLPELRWVDDIAPKARIAAYLRVNIKKDDFPPFYGLYGRHFEHTVSALPHDTHAATLAWLDAHSIDYVYVRRPSQQDSWFQADKRFRPLFVNARVAAYATPRSRAVAPQSLAASRADITQPSHSAEHPSRTVLGQRDVVSDRGRIYPIGPATTPCSQRTRAARQNRCSRMPWDGLAAPASAGSLRAFSMLLSPP